MADHQKKMEALDDFTDDVIKFMKDKAIELDLPVSGLPSVLLNAYPELCYPQIEDSVNLAGPDQGLAYIGIQTMHIQTIVKKLHESHEDITALKEKRK